MGARGLRHGGYLCLAQDHLRRKDGTMASTYTMVGYGSQGESVRRLQSELNKQGYQLDEDGVFGEKTRAAVRDYQKKNSLKRDGIAGDETWGSLMSASASAAEEPQASVPKAAPTARTAKALAELEAGYKPSESVKEALAHRDSVASQRPGAYESLYEQQLAQNQSALTASEAGVLCLSYDGMEKKLTPDKAEQVTEKQIGDAKTQYISKAKSVAKGDPLFKIITDNKWYVVAYLPNNAVAGWEAGKTSRTLNMMTEEETYKISADVESLTAGDKQTKVVFSSYEHMEDFMESRTISFSLEGTVTEGLKIPNDAIVEKSLLKIPRSCLTESMGNTGVLLVKGSSTKFTDITAVTSDEDAVYIELEDSGLKTGDVVLQGTGEDAAQVTLSELLPHAGVYVANSSIAKFVVIDVVEQNQEYAIVQAGSTTGLQPYDTIVSDAKNIKEGDSVF